MFITAQIIGLLGIIALIHSFKENNKSFLLKYQTLSNLLFAIQYIFLGAYSGCYVSITCTIRNLIFSKHENKTPKIYLILVILSMLILTKLSYKGPISFLPCIGSILFSICLSGKNLTLTRISEAIASILYILYNIKVLAITGIIFNTIELISSLVAIYKHDLKK